MDSIVSRNSVRPTAELCDLGPHDLVTVREAAAYLRVTPQVVHGYLRNGQLAGYQLPAGHWRVPWGEIHRALSREAPRAEDRCSGRRSAWHRTDAGWCVVCGKPSMGLLRQLRREQMGVRTAVELQPAELAS